MEEPKTIMIFEKPEMYFFPAYEGKIFSPYGVKPGSLKYWIYRGMNLLHIKASSMFWGEWKEHIADAKQVIVFDYGYQWGMEQYIRKKNPECKVYLFYWNIITPKRINYKLFQEKEAIYSTDHGDCKKYGFQYNDMFYGRKYLEAFKRNPDLQLENIEKAVQNGLQQEIAEEKENSKIQSKGMEKKGRIFFLGADKGRGRELYTWKNYLEKAGLRCDFNILWTSKDKAYQEELSGILLKQPLSYEEYLRKAAQADILLEIVQAGQQAPSMRVMEAIYLSKKLISNNAYLKEFDFYNENNIYILPREVTQGEEAKLKKFLETPFQEYSDDILEKYDEPAWEKRFH